MPWSANDQRSNFPSPYFVNLPEHFRAERLLREGAVDGSPRSSNSEETATVFKLVGWTYPTCGPIPSWKSVLVEPLLHGLHTVLTVVAGREGSAA
jgi:hypothetical protein